MKRIMCCMFFLIISSFSASAEVLRGQDIINFVNEWAIENDHMVIAKLNANRAFFECDAKHSIEPRNKNDLSTLRFKCNQNENPWQILIRTKQRPSSTVTGQSSSNLLVSAAKPIKKDSVIQSEDLVLVEATKRNTQSYFSSVNDVIGRKAKRTIYRDQLIKPQHVTTLWLINADQSVMIVNLAGRIRVETVGVALENGQKSDIIKVRNAVSGEIVSGVVESEKNISVLTKMN
jgi:flagella basal body P-ring formation protein FlgA